MEIKTFPLPDNNCKDFNSFENPNMIQPATFNEAKLATNSLQVKLPPFSVVVLELK